MLPMLFAALIAAAPSADTVVGTWHSQTKHGIVQIQRCGASICGTVQDGDDIRANPGIKDVNNKDASQRGRALKGLTILSGFKRGDNDWEDGSVYNPDDGRTYGGKITIVDANTLKLRGCVFVPLCKTETWTRAR